MLQRTLGSGWGDVIARVIIVGLAFIGLSAYALKLLLYQDYCLRADICITNNYGILYCCHRV